MENWNKKKIAETVLLFGLGYVSTHLLHSLINQTSSSPPQNTPSQNPKKTINFKSPEYEEIVREQLVRNYQFFGEEGQKKIRNSYIIVIGAGGIGR